MDDRKARSAAVDDREARSAAVDDRSPRLPLAGLRRAAYPVLQIDDLCLSGALSGISVDVPRGALCCLLGLGGAGKTALLRVLAGLVPPASGRALVLERDPRSQRQELLGRVGYLPPQAVLEPGLPLGRQARRSAGLCGLAPDPATARFRELCTRLGLRERLDQHPEQLPAGPRRLGEVALAVLTGSELLLLDEPSAGLAPAEHEVLWALLRERVARGLTVVYSARDAAEAEQASLVVVLHQGQVVTVWTAQELAPPRLK